MNSRQLRTIHKYQIIRSILPKFTIKVLCKIAEVSVSGYYCWKNREVKDKDIEIIAIISKIFFQHNGKIGIRRIKMELERNYNLIVNKKKIQRIKKENNLKTQIRKKERIIPAIFVHKGGALLTIYSIDNLDKPKLIKRIQQM